MRSLNSISTFIFIVLFLFFYSNQIVYAQYILKGNKVTCTDCSAKANLGSSAAVSNDGNTAVIGSYGDSSSVGSVSIWIKKEGVWKLETKITGSGAKSSSFQGFSIAIAGDGNTIAIGGNYDNQVIGAVWIFARSIDSWKEQAKLIGSKYEGSPEQGYAVALTYDGNTVAIGGPNNASFKGAVWIFNRINNAWLEESKLVGSGFGAFGSGLSFSKDGKKLAISGYSKSFPVATYIFNKGNVGWIEEIMLSHIAAGQNSNLKFDPSFLAMSENGNTVITGSPHNVWLKDHKTIGIAHIWSNMSGVWKLQATLKDNDIKPLKLFGECVSISNDGNTVVVGAPSDTTTPGAVFIYKRSDTTWRLFQKILCHENINKPYFGSAVALAGNESNLIITAPKDNAEAGAFYFYEQQPQYAINNVSILPKIITMGELLEIKYLLNNISVEKSTPSSINYYISKDALLDASDSLIRNKEFIPSMDGLASMQINNKFITPKVPEGVYYLLLVREMPENINKYEPYLKISAIKLSLPSPDFYFTNFKLNYSQREPGETISINATVGNQGLTIADFASNVEYFISKDSIYNGNAVALGKNIIFEKLDIQKTVVLAEASLAIPLSTLPGKHYVLAVLDLKNTEVESDESNNVVSTLINILYPDLINENFKVNLENMYAGDTFSTSFEIKNIGNTSTINSIQQNVYLSEDVNFDNGDKMIGNSTSYLKLDKDQKHIILSKKYVVPIATDPGKSYYLLNVIDEPNGTKESNESNNVSSAIIKINPRPLISVINPPDSVISDKEVIINVGLTSMYELDSLKFSYTKITDPSSTKTVYFKANTSNSFTIPKEYLNDKIGVEYSFLATDIQKNQSFIKQDAVYIRWHEKGLELPYNDFGGKEVNYKIIAIPLQLDKSNISSIFEKSPGVYDRQKWRILTYSNGNIIENTSGLNTIEPGKGYWFIVKNKPVTPINTGAGTTVHATIDHPFSIPLVAGWNQIGNPYHFNLSWNDIKNYKKNHSNNLLQFYTWENSYKFNDVLHAFEGAFVLAQKADTLFFPTKRNMTNNLRIGSTYLPMSNTNWQIDLNVVGLNSQNLVSGLGMNENANAGKDVLDALTPPRFGDWIELNFKHPEFFYENFAKDITSSVENFQWDFTIEDASSGPKTLQWDSSYFMNNPKKLYLYDIKSERAIDMGKVGHYFFNTRLSRNFKVYYGSELYISENVIPSTNTITSPIPNPFHSSTKIAISLSANCSNHKVSVEVYNILGENIKLIASDNYVSGFYEFTWDGKSDTGYSIEKGLYLFKVSIMSNGIYTEKTMKIEYL